MKEIRKYKPITPGLRHRITIRDKDLWKGKPDKDLTVGKTKICGRNHQGRITIRHRGGGHKRLLRLLDSTRFNGYYKDSVVIRIEYDPNRTANIALCKLVNEDSSNIVPSQGGGLYSPLGGTPLSERRGEDRDRKYYILAPQDLKAGDKIYSTISNTRGLGQTLPLNSIPLGSMIHNIQGKYIKAAGTYGILLKHSEDGKSFLIRLPSKKLLALPVVSNNHLTMATMGRVSNPNHSLTVLGKAGVSRWLGIRPTTRGTAMNPIDHPHGGKNTPSAPQTKWGKLAKWVPVKKKLILKF